MLKKLLKKGLIANETLSEIKKKVDKKCEDLKLELGYYHVKSDLKTSQSDVREWFLKNEKDLNYTLIADIAFAVENYITNVFDYYETEFEFDIPSKNSCDITIYIHLINDRIVIFKEVSKYDNYDNRWEIVGLYRAELEQEE